MLLALKVAPQRSTQYARLALTLAVPELRASPLGRRITDLEPRRLAGQDYLLVALEDELSEADAAVLARLGAISEAHEYFPSLGALEGPFLRPLELPWTPFVPGELLESRRYRGKTNELFTTVLLNLAVFAGEYATETAARLRILDPLSGGGTTLFAALVRGYDAIGIEREREDIESTDAYTRQFLRGIGVPFERTDERLRGVGRRILYNVGWRGNQRLLGLILGDTLEATALLDGLPGGRRFHAIVTDLPYGIHHQGQVRDLLTKAIPGWEQHLLPGGTVALAWEASRLPREEAITIATAASYLIALDQSPYNEVEHAVDRAIKRRDVLVLRAP